MSRAYRIKVSETVRRILKADDRVSTQLEILNVLPPAEMSDLLRAELERRGFQEQDGQMVREEDGIRVLVNPADGTVTVEAAECKEIELSESQEGWTYDNDRQRATKAQKEKLRGELERQADRHEAALQAQLTDQLEAQLGDLRQELDQIATQVTAEALKRKARQMGQIKEITEDLQSGSMTIVLEV
jgi:hypothetical protein